MKKQYERFIARLHDRLTKGFSDPIPKVISGMKNPPFTALEIGVAQGEGMRIILKAMLKRSKSVEYYGYDLFAEGFPPKFTYPDRAKVRLRQGDSKEILAKDLEWLPKFDFIHIDGGHDYETVKADWENCQKLMKSDTVVVFDDYQREAGVTRLVNEISKKEYVIIPLNVKHVSFFPFKIKTYVGKAQVTLR
jgi:hypothetical protein